MTRSLPTAPKITTIHIPIDKVGEVIGPKGKVINTIQSETGADISVDDDGAQGIVTIGAVEAWRMEEAKAAILAIVDPPKAELGKVYNGRVVNITKFGAFVNILPGRDGLVHISKLGGGKRINAVEDVLTLGQEIEVRVDEIDDKGKVSLSPAGDPPASTLRGSPTRRAQCRPAVRRATVRAQQPQRRHGDGERRQRLVRGGVRRRAAPTSSATSVRPATARPAPVPGDSRARSRQRRRPRCRQPSIAGRRRHR